MIVVSDTSPITALVTIGREELLRELFHEVVIPLAVKVELLRSHTKLPDWIRCVSVKNMDHASQLAVRLDLGEAESIVLAKETNADWLLIDEKKGRAVASKEGVPVIGLLGVLALAKRRSILSAVRPILDRLQNEAGMYLSHGVWENLLEALGEGLRV